MKTRIPPITIDQEIYQQIKVLAKEDNKKIAEVVRFLLDKYIESKKKGVTVDKLISKFGFREKTIKPEEMDDVIYTQKW